MRWQYRLDMTSERQRPFAVDDEHAVNLSINVSGDRWLLAYQRSGNNAPGKTPNQGLLF